jgi:hypothetical protein
VDSINVSHHKWVEEATADRGDMCMVNESGSSAASGRTIALIFHSVPVADPAIHSRPRVGCV